MIRNTLFANYIKDRLNQEIIENENGFIIYSINGNACFLHEMYIKPESRKSGQGKALLNELKVIALDAGCDFISATVHQFDKNAHFTLMGAFACGFKVHQAHNNVITINLIINGGL